MGARRKPGGEAQETASYLKVAPVVRLAQSLAVVGFKGPAPPTEVARGPPEVVSLKKSCIFR